MTIDAHQHFWRIARGDYSWMDGSVAAISVDHLPEDLAQTAADCDVTKTVVVQAAPTIAETKFLLELAETSNLIGAVVGWIDLEGDVAGQLADIAHPALRGIRPMLQDIEQTDWILRPDVIKGLRQIAEAGLRLDALVTPRHLDVIDHLAQEIPNLPIVIDHCAKPVFNGTDPGDDWREGMSRLASHPQVYCKLSGLANEFGTGWSARTLRSVFDHVIVSFGAQRVMWGSDWPVLNLAGDYRGWYAAAQELARDLTEEERDYLFERTASAFYDITA
ncbi:amidohydrolase family protein [Celeribacter sp.]|uniref:amidohydrolase family protein n=1 Tax=Celeribacter sp. TaxID=1890673 RepID=UPI003A95906F